MDGLDTLIFTAGIGERSAVIRSRICAGLTYLGIELDAGRNAAHAPVISTTTSRVVVRVVPTDEDLIIARHTLRLVREGVLADSGHDV
jgi:acetate kinase